MVKIYIDWILSGRKAIDDVPAKWKEKVKEALAEREKPEETADD